MSDFSMDPVTRKEFYLAEITGMDVDAPAPVTRLETYLNDIINGTASQLAPVTRLETYLAKISGADVTIPAPVTRLELYLAKIAGMDVEIPDPVTREEHWLWMWANAGPGGSAVTVEGEAPITLADAIHGAIRSLIQYGLCYQASTPTPAAPVDIVCNNGTLKMVDDELPLAYKRITGIKFDGDFWYNTGEALDGGDAVTMTLANTATGGQNVFGSYNGTASGTKNFSLFIYGGGSNSNSYYRYGEQLLRPKYGSNERRITISGNGTDGFTTDVTATPDTFVTEAPAYIGMLPNSSSAAYTGSIMGSIDVVNNGQLRLRWIPCERQSDGAVGYYELKSGTFLEQVGTGSPVKGGYDTSHMTEFIIDGTPEVLTVSATGATPQTASVQDLLAVDDYRDEQNIISGSVKRKVGIKIFDGTEDWTKPSSADYFRLDGLFEDAIPYSADNPAVVCSHFVGRVPKTAASGMDDGDIKLGYTSTYNRLYLKYSSATTSDELKAWVAAQYAAGTPVIVLYPLAEEVAEQVPPQKLYVADGSNTVSVVANVSPVNLECTYIAADA